MTKSLFKRLKEEDIHPGHPYDGAFGEILGIAFAIMMIILIIIIVLQRI